MDFKFIPTAIALTLSACASAQSLVPTANVPDNLKPGAGESVAMIAAAKGVQIYECRIANNQSGGYEWAFVAPEAVLFDATGRTIGTHYAGPQWEAMDGSRIAGAVKERSDAPDADAIPWLLLTAKSVGGPGSFSAITSVQRVNTRGGVAPRAGCSQSVAGSILRVPYAADYYFLAAKSAFSSTIRTTAAPATEQAGGYY